MAGCIAIILSLKVIPGTNNDNSCKTKTHFSNSTGSQSIHSNFDQTL